jgi:hypothetical protein
MKRQDLGRRWRHEQSREDGGEEGTWEEQSEGREKKDIEDEIVEEEENAKQEEATVDLNLDVERGEDEKAEAEEIMKVMTLEAWSAAQEMNRRQIKKRKRSNNSTGRG